MPLADPSVSPTFSDVYRLLDLVPKNARWHYAQVRTHVVLCEGYHRYAIANAHLDRQRVLDSHKTLLEARRRETEAQMVLVLLDDASFRRMLMTLDIAWRHFRIARPGVTNDRFADAIMAASDDQTVELRACWQRICDIIASKVTVTPTSALAF